MMARPTPSVTQVVGLAPSRCGSCAAKISTASALTNIGNRYKEFGLKSNATAKYEQALDVCEDIMKDARALGGIIGNPSGRTRAGMDKIDPFLTQQTRKP